MKKIGGIIFLIKKIFRLVLSQYFHHFCYRDAIYSDILFAIKSVKEFRLIWKFVPDHYLGWGIRKLHYN